MVGFKSKEINMKRTIYTAIAAIIPALAACNKELCEEIPANDGRRTITLTAAFPKFDGETGTKTAISGNATTWSEKDSIAVFTKKGGKPAKFILTEGANSTSGVFSGSTTAKTGDTLFVAYPYPSDKYGYGYNASATKLNFNGQTQDGFGANAEAHLGKFAYMASEPVVLSDEGSTIAFTHLATKMAFEFSLPEDATVKFLSMATSLSKFYDMGTVDLTADSPAAKGFGTAKRTFSLGFKDSKVSAGEKVTAYAMMLPASLATADITFYISAETTEGKPVTYTVKKGKGLKFEAAKSYVAEVPTLSKFNTGQDMVFVPGGSMNICGIFSEDSTANQTVLKKDYRVDSFWIGVTEVTNQQFCDFINKRAAARPLSDVVLSGWVDTTVCQIRKADDKWVPKSGPILQADGSQKAGSYADYPAFGVSYLGAGAYTAYLVETELGYTSKDSGYYLPTEAQWEYAAAGSEWNPDWENESIAGCSDETAYNKYMWSCRNCDSEGSSCLGSYIGNAGDPNSISGSGSKTGGTHPVGKLLPNYLGIYDLSGNVCEICSDYFNSDTYPYGSALNPRNTSQSSALSVDGAPAVCVRGGNWFSYPSYGITWTRDYVTKQLKYNFMGFRVMLPLK